MAEQVYDALVIGSGASGSMAAKELTAQGLSVLMLEAGRKLESGDFDPKLKIGAKQDLNVLERAEATVKGQAVQARAAFFRKWSGHFFINDRKNPYTTPPDAPYLWVRGRQVGGRMHSFGRVLMRWSDDDFKGQSRRSVGVDWPISYAELAPFYDEVEQYLGIWGNADNAPTMPDGKYASRAALSPAEESFQELVETQFPGRRVISWRYMAPDPERVYRPLRDALASGRLELRHNSVVRRITTDERTGAATGAEVIDSLTGRVSTVRAATVVLCASPIESVRLLLNSTSARHPAGLGNSSGNLGRYFMDQIPCVAQGSFPPVKGWAEDPVAPRDPFYNPSGGIWVTRDQDPQSEQQVSDFAYQGAMGRAPVEHNAPSRWLFFGFGQMQPHADNRITLDPRRKDAWGISVPHIRCAMHDEEFATLRKGEATLIDMVNRTGGTFEFVGSPLGLREMGKGAYPQADFISRFLFRLFFRRTMVMGAAIHESGGARMGSEPSSSVLNPFNQSWDVPNLYVTDASAFASSGVTGTTLTVMALTVRACRHLAHKLRAERSMKVAAGA